MRNNIFTTTIIGGSIVAGLLIIMLLSIAVTVDGKSPQVPQSVSATFQEWKELDAQAKLKQDKIDEIKASLQQAEEELQELNNKANPKRSYIESQGYKVDESTMSLKDAVSTLSFQ